MKDEVITLNEDKGYSIELTVSQDSVKQSESQKSIDIQKVLTNHKYWYQNSNLSATNNFEDPDFKEIVGMGERAVPGILKIIRKKPDAVVHALDLIYPDMMTYEGFVPLEEVCKIWIITLTALGKA